MNDDTTEQFACTLDPQGARQRLPQVRALTDRLQRRERLDDRLVLTFADDAGTVELVEEFVRDESRCCGFFGFEIRHEGAQVVLELSAPTQAGHMLDAAMRSFDPDLNDDDMLDNYREHADEGIVQPGT